MSFVFGVWPTFCSLPLLRTCTLHAAVASARKQPFIGIAGRAFYRFFFGWFGSQGQPRQPIRYQVYPKDMDGEQWDGEPQYRRKKDNQYFTAVTGQYVQNEFSDVVINTPAFLYGFHDGGEIIIQ